MFSPRNNAVKKMVLEAMKLYRQAADKGNRTAIQKSNNNYRGIEMQKDIQEVFILINKKYGSSIFDNTLKLACILKDVAPWLQEEIRVIERMSLKNLGTQLVAGPNSFRKQLERELIEAVKQNNSKDQEIMEQYICLIGYVVNQQILEHDTIVTNGQKPFGCKARKLSDKDMRQEIRTVLRINNGLSDTILCQKLTERGVDHSFYKRAVTQMVIKGKAEYKSNKLYLKGSDLLVQENLNTKVTSGKTHTASQRIVKKDSEDAVRNEVIRLLRINKRTGLTNAQIVGELEKNGFSIRWFDRIRTRLVIDSIAEYRGNRMFILR